MVHENDESLVDAGQTHTWKLPDLPDDASYSHFRIWMTGPNSDGMYRMRCTFTDSWVRPALYLGLIIRDPVLGRNSLVRHGCAIERESPY